MTDMNEVLEPVKRINKDIIKMIDKAVPLTKDEARFLVDAYYIMQDQRIRTFGQVRAMDKSGEQHAVIDWLAEQSETLENQVKRALDKYSWANEVGQWARSVCGVGPVICSGLLAHIDIEKAPTVGHIWRFAGLDPTMKWEKGQKRPWNAGLKTLCWKLGESFVKVSGHKDDYYGKVYLQRKEWEHQQNEAGAYKEQAEAILKSRPTHAQKDIYAQGKLPDGHLHMRAKRYAVKRFLADLQVAWYWLHYGKLPPSPYPIAILEHAHYELSPTFNSLPELQKALAERGAQPVQFMLQQNSASETQGKENS